MLDPTCPDITGRVLEALARARPRPRSSAPCARGVDWLVRNQEPDGSWYGRWGVAYIYGTCFALRGLAASGERRPRGARPARRRMAALHSERRWRLGRKLRQLRQRHLHRRRRSTPSQTAWAILGLIAGGDTTSLSVQHGIEYLLETQRADGSWDEELATGTGFPKVFYLELPLLQGLLPAARAVFVREGPARQLEWIAYEISTLDDRRPGRIHFQEQDAAAPGVAEERRRRRRTRPTRSASCRTKTGEKRQPHPMISKRFPHRADARAAARLQPHLHRLRPHPRVRIHHHRARAARRVPGGGGRVRRAGGLHLRRRAA